MSKEASLYKLAAEMAADASLPLATNLVFGEGSPDAEIVFVGEAPGAEEDKQVRPFVGRSGQLLRKCIREAGLKEEDVYITNIVKRRPPENRDPSPEEIAVYKPYLTRQLAVLAPKVIVPLGRFSMNYFLPEAKITRDQGTVFRLKSGVLIYPMFHPAAALRNPASMTELVKGMKRLPAVLKKWAKPGIMSP
jgi:uracil-DNA glycosylase